VKTGTVKVRNAATASPLLIRDMLTRSVDDGVICWSNAEKRNIIRVRMH